MDSNRYLTGQKVSQLFNVSSKTIRNEIKILNQLMNNFALIQSIPSHGYQISIFDDDLFNCLLVTTLIFNSSFYYFNYIISFIYL